MTILYRGVQYFLDIGIGSSVAVGEIWPPPCSDFSLTKIDDHHAVLYGGRLSHEGATKAVNDVYLIKLEKLVGYTVAIRILKVLPCQQVEVHAR